MDLVFCNLKLKASFTDNTEDALTAPRRGLGLLRKRRQLQGAKVGPGSQPDMWPRASHFPCRHPVYSFVKPRGCVTPGALPKGGPEAPRASQGRLHGSG